MKSSLVFFLTLAFAALTGPTGLGAENSPPHAVALFTTDPPIVDGTWTSGEWEKATPLVIPTPPKKTNAADPPPTEVRFLWNEEGVYVGFRSFDSNPVYGDFAKGQPIYEDDVFELFFDHIGDHRQYFEIQIDPAAQTFIKTYILTAPPELTSEGRLSPEFTESELWRYDFPEPEGFQAASQFDPETGIWTSEMFLPAPFANRRRGGALITPGTWRINLVRHDWDRPFNDPQRVCQFLYWAPVLEGHPHLSPTLMGSLEFKNP